jgi:hypothetical protein
MERTNLFRARGAKVTVKEANQLLKNLQLIRGANYGS